MISIAEARRIALAALGFHRPRQGKPDVRQIRGVIQRLGLVQIDSVNVLVPAHYLVLFSRLGATAVGDSTTWCIASASVPNSGRMRHPSFPW